MAASTLTIKDSLGGTTTAFEASVPVQLEVVNTIPDSWLAGPLVATIVAGAGIGATSPSSVGAATIANAGVISLNGLTGTPSVVGGTGATITVAGATITVTPSGVPNSALLGPEVTAVVAGSGISVVSAGTVGAATVSVSSAPWNQISSPSKPVYTLSPNGGHGGDGGDFGPNSLGQGLSTLTPVGSVSTTGGFQEAMDYLKSLGGGNIVQTGPVTGTGQFMFRSGVSFDCQGYLMTCTTAMPTPFMTDANATMQNTRINAYVSCGTNSPLDVVINPLGGTTIGTVSPWTSPTNTNPYYQVYMVATATLLGTCTAITAPDGLASPMYDGVCHYGIFPVAPGQNIKVTFKGYPPPISILSGVIASGRADAQTVTTVQASALQNEYRWRFTSSNAGNGFLGCSWYVPGGTVTNVTGGDNNSCNQTRLIACDGATGPYGVRFLGAGKSNSNAFIDQVVENIVLPDIGGGVNTSGTVTCTGVDFGFHVDHVKVLWAALTGDAGAVTGSSLVMFNDGVFGARNVDQKVSICGIEDGIFVWNGTNTYYYVVDLGNCGENASHCYMTKFPGAGQATPVNVVPPVGLAIPSYFDGYDNMDGVLWRRGQPFNVMMGSGGFFTSGMGALNVAGWDVNGASSGAPPVNYSGSGYGPNLIYTCPLTQNKGLSMIFAVMELTGAGSGTATYTITYYSLGGVKTQVLSSSVAGETNGNWLTWQANSGTVTVQFANAATPWTAYLACFVVPVVD
jgi:hypothetical protein